MTQVYSLEQRLADRFQGSMNVSEFYTLIKTIWDELHDANPMPYCTCNKCTSGLTQKIHTREQEHRLIQFMMKLNDTLSTVRGNILMTQPLPKLSQANRSFTQEERHKELTQTSVST